ncbi:MAG: L,D-transpeptidase family protein [Candidatus Aminicenantales bacterium]
MNSGLKSAVLVFCVVCAGACRTPPVPSEVEKAKTQENQLWRAGAPVYAPSDYARYLESLRLAKEKLIKQNARMRWFRNYEEAQTAYIAILAQGDALNQKVEAEKRSQSRDFSAGLVVLQERIAKLKALTRMMNEHAPVRQNLARAEVAFQEARTFLQNEKYTALAEKLVLIDGHIRQAEDALFSILARYADDAQVARWRKWADETIAESRRKGTTAILVNKLERTLTLLKKGKAVAVFEIGLGKYGLTHKLFAGDEATPEGRYRVIKKNANSRYHKALLIDYPNEEDRKRFSLAKKKNLISARASIGGLIEIHGGGNDFLTNGCVGVEDSVMDKIFPEVAVGTAVTIIGSLENAENLLAEFRKSGS